MRIMRAVTPWIANDTYYTTKGQCQLRYTEKC
jgi:hypothetical protein